MATRTISAAGGNWNSNGTWDEGAVPTAADDVVARGDGTSGNVTIAANAVCRSANFTNYVGTLTRNSGISWTIGDGTAGAGNVALTFVAGMTWTDNAPTTAVTFASSSATQQTITSGGKTINRLAFTGAGSWVHTDAAASAANTGSITLSAGTWNTGNQAISTGQIISLGTTARVMTLGSSTVTLSNAGAVFTTGGSNLTINAGTSTLVVSDTSATQKTITTPLTLNNLTVSPGGSGVMAINGGPTFNVFTATGPKTVGFDTTATTTATQWNFNGYGGNGVTLGRSNATNPTATISQAAGAVSATCCTIGRIVATGGARFTNRNGTDNGNNTGWKFLQGILSGIDSELLTGAD